MLDKRGEYVITVGDKKGTAFPFEGEDYQEAKRKAWKAAESYEGTGQTVKLTLITTETQILLEINAEGDPERVATQTPAKPMLRVI